MPTYDYRCEACGHAFDFFQSIKADAVKTCPSCGQERVRRVIGAGGGFIFKGSGFYITDYTRSKDYKEKAKSEGGGGKVESKPAESKPAESKPADPKPAAPSPSPGGGSSGAPGGGGGGASASAAA